MKKIRDKFAFHYDRKVIGSGFAHVGEETLDIYFGNDPGNLLFHCSEVAIGRAITKNETGDKAQENLDEALSFVPLAKDWADFVLGFFLAFFRRHPAVRYSDLDIERTGPDRERISIPWFTERGGPTT